MSKINCVYLPILGCQKLIVFISLLWEIKNKLCISPLPMMSKINDVYLGCQSELSISPHPGFVKN